MTPFILAAGRNETLIVNRLCFGVGVQFLAAASFESEERDLICRLLTKRREEYGDGVVVFDCGANIGSHTIAWAKHMLGWGSIIAIEAQERIFYALAGNIALNNCFNARAVNAAVSKAPGMMGVPMLNYNLPAHFSGLELRKRPDANGVGQEIDYDKTMPVQVLTIDCFKMPRVDLIKIDVESMDLEVLIGAENTIADHRPIIYVEVLRNKDEICSWLADHGYSWLEPNAVNVLATHKNDISYDV